MVISELAAMLIETKKPIVCVSGGRTSGKSWSCAQALLYRGLMGEERILAAREFQASLEQSAMALHRKLALDDPMLEGKWATTARVMRSITGSEIMYRGLSEATGTSRSLRSMEGITLTHVEEAQYVSRASMEEMMPVVRRAPGSQVFFTYNPRFPSDPVHQLATSGREDVLHLHVDWRRLAAEGLLGAGALQEIEQFKEQFEDRYACVYLGKMDEDELGVRRVLAWRDVERAFAAGETVEAEGQVHGGFDVADQGSARNCLALRRGGVVFHVERWSGRGSTVGRSASRAFGVAAEHGATKVFYDAGGLGSGVRSEVERQGPPGEWIGVNFGGRPAKPNVWYTVGQRQKDAFANRAAQLAWAVRLRAEKLKAGEGNDGIAFGPEVKRWQVEGDMMRPTWDDRTGKIVVKKAERGEESPDVFDAVVLAFGADSEQGLCLGKSPYERWREARALRLVS